MVRTYCSSFMPSFPKREALAFLLLAERFMSPRDAPSHRGAGLVSDSSVPNPAFVLVVSSMPLTPGKGSGVILACHAPCPCLTS